MDGCLKFIISCVITAICFIIVHVYPLKVPYNFYCLALFVFIFVGVLFLLEDRHEIDNE